MANSFVKPRRLLVRYATCCGMTFRRWATFDRHILIHAVQRVPWRTAA